MDTTIIKNFSNDVIVMPAVTGDEALEHWKKYQDLKTKIIEKSDIQVIKGKEFLKKSYWRKIATFFNLTVEIVEERHEAFGGTYVWHFVCKAIAPNGRSAIGTGSCDAYEKAVKKEDGLYYRYDEYKGIWVKVQPNTIHNIRSTAESRAFNRAVSNLVGGGEVSAEEVATVRTENGVENLNNETPDEDKLTDEVSKGIEEEKNKNNPAYRKK